MFSFQLGNGVVDFLSWVFVIRAVQLAARKAPTHAPEIPETQSTCYPSVVRTQTMPWSQTVPSWRSILIHQSYRVSTKTWAQRIQRINAVAILVRGMVKDHVSLRSE